LCDICDEIKFINIAEFGRWNHIEAFNILLRIFLKRFSQKPCI
jgi:hypothetical protein